MVYPLFQFADLFFAFQVLHLQWEAAYDPHYPPVMALRAYVLPDTPTQLISVHNNPQSAARPSTLSVNHEALPDVLLQVCTGTRVSLVPLSRKRGYTDHEAIADSYHHRNPTSDGTCSGFSKRENWVLQHRAIHTAAIANWHKAGTDGSSSCSQSAENPCAVQADHRVSVGHGVTVIDCDHFVRTSVPRILGHSHFDLLDFFVLPCIPGAYTLPPTVFSADRSNLQSVQYQSHTDMPGSGSIDRDNSMTCTSADTASFPVGDVEPASSLIIITALVRAALLVKSPLTDMEPSCRVSGHSAHSGVRQGCAGLTDRHEGATLCSTSAEALHPYPSSDDASLMQHCAQSLAQRLAATGIWHSPSACDRIAQPYDTQPSQAQSPMPDFVRTAQGWKTANRKRVRDSGLSRHGQRLQTAPPYAQPDSRAQRANETVAVRSITLVAYLGPANQADEGTDDTTESDLAISSVQQTV